VAHCLIWSSALMYDMQMFTDFVSECRAEGVKDTLSVDTRTIRRKSQPVLDDVPERAAVATFGTDVAEGLFGRILSKSGMMMS
jgi:hypothetical protein